MGWDVQKRLEGCEVIFSLVFTIAVAEAAVTSRVCFYAACFKILILFRGSQGFSHFSQLIGVWT